MNLDHLYPYGFRSTLFDRLVPEQEDYLRGMSIQQLRESVAHDLELSMNATVEQLAPVEQQATNNWVVAALYQFKEVSDAADLQQRLLTLVNSINLCGTLIVAPEGINGTVAGDRTAIDTVHQFLLNEGFNEMEYKESFSSDKPFRKMKIKLKKEIVTLGVEVKPRELS